MMGGGGASIPTTGDYESMLNEQKHEMSMQVSEKEIEIERLKTTVVSLNHKCAIVDDHKEDVSNANNRFAESETQRVVLQEHIVETSETVKVDTATHNAYQQELIE